LTPGHSWRIWHVDRSCFREITAFGRLPLALTLLAAATSVAPARDGSPARSGSLDGGQTPGRGASIYQRLCASCHGAAGQGVRGKRSEPLTGEKSVEDLSRYIAKSMPEDNPGACVGEDADSVARYIFDEFYSPIAQERRKPARVELARLTVAQHRNAIADLIDSLRVTAKSAEPDGDGGGAAGGGDGGDGSGGPGASAPMHGLRGRYSNSRRPGRQAALDRIDPEVRFDFGAMPPAPGTLDGAGFGGLWDGSLTAFETGEYEIKVRTDHAARLWLNDEKTPLIDAWVKSGSDVEYRAPIFLLGGRSYPIRLEFTSRKQGVDDKKKVEEKPIPAFLELWWKAPGEPAEVIPSRALSPRRARELFVVHAPFPPDDRSAGYERGASVSKDWDDAATAAAAEAADYVVAHLDELSGSRRNDADRDAKARETCSRLVALAFRAPLTEEERGTYVDRRFEPGVPIETAVQRVALLALKSPRFLYPNIGVDSRSPYAAATRLAFALWDSIPDAALLDAARSQRLLSGDELRRQAERMLDDPRARAKVRSFFHQWLRLDGATDLSKDAKLFPGFLRGPRRGSEDVARSFPRRGRLGAELRLPRAVSRERALRQRARLGVLRLRVAGAGAVPGRDAGRPSTLRGAVASLRALALRLSGRQLAHPPRRILVRSVLGRALRPPPAAFAPLAPDLHPDLTTRERVELQTRPEACQSCHSAINALGFTLEEFDAVGRFRSEERGKPIDAVGSCQLASGESVPLQGAKELAAFLAGSAEAHRAFVVQLFHYVVKQPVMAYGPRTPETLRELFAASGFNVRRLLLAIACDLRGPRCGAPRDFAVPRAAAGARSRESIARSRGRARTPRRGRDAAGSRRRSSSARGQARKAIVCPSGVRGGGRGRCRVACRPAGRGHNIPQVRGLHVMKKMHTKNHPQSITRRRFLERGAAIAAGVASAPFIVPSGVLASQEKPGANDRVRVGFIGSGHRARLLMDQMPAGAQIIAISDVFRKRCEEALKEKKASWTVYQDYRKLLESKDIDAVIVPTTDHARVLCCNPRLPGGQGCVRRETSDSDRERGARPRCSGAEAQKDPPGREPAAVHGDEPLRLRVRAERRPREAPRSTGLQLHGPGSLRWAARRACARRPRLGHVVRSYGPQALQLESSSRLDGLPGLLRRRDDELGSARHRPGAMGARRRHDRAGGSVAGDSRPQRQSQPPLQERADRQARARERAHGRRGIYRRARPARDRPNRFTATPGDLVKDPPEPQKAEIWEGPGWQAKYHIQNWLDCLRTRALPVADVEIGHRSITVCHLANIAREVGRKLRWDPDTESILGDEAASAYLARPRRKGYELPDPA
jgi:mono/diheme cytochrome c family protein